MNKTNGRQLIIEAGARLGSALEDKRLVLLDRFGSAYRNVYTDVSLITALPEAAICNYYPWGEKKPKSIVSQELKTKTRIKDSANKYDFGIEDEIRTLLEDDKRLPVFATWFETGNRRRIADSANGTLLCVGKDTREFIEDKSNFSSIVEKSGISLERILPTAVFSSFKDLPSYETLQAQLGNVFVIQGESMGGSGTSFIRSKGDMDAAAEKSIGRVRVTKFFGGQYSSTSVLTVPRPNGDCDVYIDLPTHKTTDIKEVGVPEIMGAGNEYSVTYGKLIGEQFISTITSLAKYLFKAHGLVGVWAVEGFIEDGEFFLNEINCRPVGGTEVSSANQLLRNFPPFIVIHNLVFLKQGFDWLPDSSSFNNETVQMITGEKNKGPFYLKIKAKDEHPVTPKDTFRGSGVYKLNKENELVWVRAGQSTLQANFDKYEVLVADAPLYGSICYKSVELCTLEGVGLERHIFKGPRKLTEDGYRLAEAIYKQFTIASI